MTYDPIIYPVTLTRGCVAEWYIYLPGADNQPQDLTGTTLEAVIKDRPNGTTLATPVCETGYAPYNSTDSRGWVRMRVDNSVVIPSGHFRGTWSLTISVDSDNDTLVAAGPVEIQNIA